MSSQPRALIVEDDRAWQQILGELLADAGLAVDVADSIPAAVAALKAAPHRLAVVDLSLAGGDHRNQDGLRVLDAARRLDPRCVTIMLTGFATVELAVSALGAHGALTCLRKEKFNRAEFRELVKRALATAPAAHVSAGDVAAPQAGVSQAVHPAAARPSGDALVVEDDAGWQNILTELLTDAGYRVRVCSGFGEALGCLRREKFGLAAVDLSLGGIAEVDLWKPAESAQALDGYRLLASTRAAGLPTIVVSGVAAPADIERAYAEHGIFAYLEKQTFTRQAFLEAVAGARAAANASGELERLTARERMVLELLARGLTNKEIAEALVITENTVKRHLKSIFGKLAVHTRAAAAAKAISAGIPADLSEPGDAASG